MTKHYNQTRRIILLGDDTNKCIANSCGIDFFHYADYSEEIPYYHVSVNGREYEKFCFERWFIIYNFLTKHRIDHFVHSDSDNVICQDIEYSEFKHGVIGNYKEKYAIVPNILFSSRTYLRRIIGFYRTLYSQDYPEFIEDIRNFSSIIVQENPPVQISCMHYSDMYFLLQAIYQLNLDYSVLPESGDIPVIYNGNYTNHPIMLKDGVFIHETTGQRMFNIHFQGQSKVYISRFFTELTGLVE